MNDIALLLLGMLAFGLLLRGGWWYFNWKARHPQPLLPAGYASGSYTAGGMNAGKKVDLPVLFRMSTASQVILCILLLSPAVILPILLRDEWDGIDGLLANLLETLLNPGRLILTAVIYLLCPYTAWNIYWRRKDFIRIEAGLIEYRSGFTSGKLVPENITMLRGRSWRFDLVDLFRGQMATSWFLEVIPAAVSGKKNKGRETEPVILDLKAMNLGGSARSIARAASQVFGAKFVINNQLPK